MIDSNKIKIEIDIPVYNEEACLEKNINKLIAFLKSNNFAFTYKIVIIDNGSTDKTANIALGLENRYPEIEYLKINQRGRGRALKSAWQLSSADIVSYMDVDLSTNLKSFNELINLVSGGGYDIVTGSRMLPESKVRRSIKRELISRGYIFCLKNFLKVSFDDAQCGFKALNRKVIANILPQVIDQEWFFDSELLFRCQQANYKIKEIPIEWLEDKNSKVKIIPTTINYLSSLKRLKKEFNQKTHSQTEFDNYAKNYNYGLDNNFKKIFGDQPDDFFKPKVDWLKNFFKKTYNPLENTIELLDLGCGTGLFIKKINDLKLNINLSGADTSIKMLAEAKLILNDNLKNNLHLITDNYSNLPQNHFDIITISSVLHHIDKSERLNILNNLTKLLKPNGYLIIFEHNPLNPITNVVVKTTKIDKNAILLKPKEIRNYFNKITNIKFINLNYLMFFPPRFNNELINFLERKIIKLPLGGQYVIVGKKI